MQNLNTLTTVYSNDFVMVRVDKTMYDIMFCKPQSRWDPSYWNYEYDEVMSSINKIYPLEYFNDKYITDIGQGDVPRKNKGEEFVKKGVRLMEVEHIKNTGIYLLDTRFIMHKQYERLKRVELVNDCILIVRSGATIGKITIVTKINEKVVINGHINRIICKNINPYYLTTFMKTIFGQMQLDRFCRGVAQPELNFDEIKSILIVILPDTIQSNIETEYKKMAAYHDKAMEAKAVGNEEEFKENIEIAELMLKDLIAKTEAVIRGEREDVV